MSGRRNRIKRDGVTLAGLQGTDGKAICARLVSSCGPASGTPGSPTPQTPTVVPLDTPEAST